MANSEPATPNLANDIAEARAVLLPMCQRQKGLIQLWNIFTSAKQVLTVYIEKFDELSYQAKLSFSKSIVVDYAKPWTGNRSSALQSLKLKGSFPFLSDVEDGALHTEILELRHKLVAHIDDGYEGLSVTLAGGTVVNENPHRPRDEGTLKEVFIPTVVRMGSVRGMWWIESKKKLEEFLIQVEGALAGTQAEITTSANELFQQSLSYMHVLKKIPDVIAIHEFPSEDFNIQVNPFADHPGSLNIDEPVNLGFGDANIQSLAAVYESTPGYTANTSVDGKGYNFLIGDETTGGTFQMQVVFPKYPYPKEPLAK